jgi:RimJ/RimL family protein N-acetyltransferase
MSITFHSPSVDDAALLLKWRTDPEISRNMFTDLEHSDLSVQKKWVKSVLIRKDYVSFIIHDEGKPVGFLSFNDIDYKNKKCSSGSYIYCKKARLKLAVTLHSYICSFAFYCLGMNKIVNLILDVNENVIKIQQLHNTQFVGILREHIYKNGEFYDVHIFEQLRSTWEERKQRFEVSHMREAFKGWNDRWMK